MKHTIWSSIINFEAWEGDREEICEEFHINPSDDSKFEDAVYELNSTYLDDERLNLSSIETPAGLIVFGKASRWDGKSFGIFSTDEESISGCLRPMEDYWQDYSFDVEDDLTITGYHHDGTDVYTVRKWNSLEAKAKALELLDEGVKPYYVFNEFTSSVASLISQVYGWKI